MTARRNGRSEDRVVKTAMQRLELLIGELEARTQRLSAWHESLLARERRTPVEPPSDGALYDRLRRRAR